MSDKLRKQERLGQNTLQSLQVRSGTTPDPRRYNEPTSRDIAVVYTGDDPPGPRDINVYCRTPDGCGDTHVLNTLNEHADPLTYSLIHMYGEKGWCPDLHISSDEHTAIEKNLEPVNSVLNDLWSAAL